LYTSLSKLRLSKDRGYTRLCLVFLEIFLQRGYYASCIGQLKSRFYQAKNLKGVRCVRNLF